MCMYVYACMCMYVYAAAAVAVPVNNGYAPNNGQSECVYMYVYVLKK
jgi:hypothetical protein